jgi:hypothetical protein
MVVRTLKDREERVLNTVKVEPFYQYGQCPLASIVLVRTNSCLPFLVFVSAFSTFYIEVIFSTPPYDHIHFLGGMSFFFFFVNSRNRWHVLKLFVGITIYAYFILKKTLNPNISIDICYNYNGSLIILLYMQDFSCPELLNKYINIF